MYHLTYFSNSILDIYRNICLYHDSYYWTYIYIYCVILHLSSITNKNKHLFLIFYSILYLMDGFKLLDNQKNIISNNIEDLNDIHLCILFTFYNYFIVKVLEYKQIVFLSTIFAFIAYYKYISLNSLFG